MTKIKTLFVACLFMVGTIQAQSYEWTKTFGGTGYEYGNSLITDAFGNIYVIGHFFDTVDFDIGNTTDIHISNGDTDIFIEKLDVNGNFLWAKTFGGSGSELGYSITLDVSGNIYITGAFNDTVDFDPGSATLNHVSSGYYDIFIEKLDANGNFLWVNTIGGPEDDFGLNIITDNNGNVYTTGAFKATVDFDSDNGVDNHTSVGNNDIFIHKLDPNGNFLWAKTLGGSFNDEVTDVKVDANGNPYILGYFLGTTDFDPGIGVVNHTSLGGTDVFIEKLDGNGNFQWAKTFGGTSYDFGSTIMFDASGSIYSIGRFNDIVDFDPGNGSDSHTSLGGTDVFIQKLDANGNFVWTKTFGGIDDDAASSITKDSNGNIYIAGIFKDTVDFDFSSGMDNHYSNGGTDIYIEKLDTNGNFLWTKTFGGTNFEYSTFITIDSFESIYTLGFFEGTLNFDPGNGTDNHTSLGGYDVFIHKLSQSNIGVNEFSNNIQVVAYPNPTTGIVNVTSNHALKNVELILLDIQGNQVLAKNYESLTNITINLNNLSGGIYILSIKTPQGVETMKLIKE